MMKKFFEITGIFLLFLGLTMSFVDRMEWLPNPRKDLADRITALGEKTLPLDTPYVDDLLLHFLSAKNPRLNREVLGKALKDFDGIEIENLTLDGRDTLGSVRIKKKDSNNVAVICGFQELRIWASNPWWIWWTGWTLALVGALLKLFIFLLGRSSPPTKSVTEELPCKETQPVTTSNPDGGEMNSKGSPGPERPQRQGTRNDCR
jgi:hypothetical protein